MESKTYVFGENGTSTGGGLNSVLAMLPALLQKQGVDPGLLALCNSRGNGNSWGDNLFAILLLFIIMGRGNFFGGGYGGGMMPNGQGGVVPMSSCRLFSATAMTCRAWLQPSTHRATL